MIGNELEIEPRRARLRDEGRREAAQRTDACAMNLGHGWLPGQGGLPHFLDLARRRGGDAFTPLWNSPDLVRVPRPPVPGRAVPWAGSPRRGIAGGFCRG